ncbi:MAG: hypothetical protein GU359_04820 [Desulfurococcales archaeon]|nr:hypothetical protein [Desulfurococcales archaeon]
MSNKDLKKSRGVERLEIVLRPCINVVYGDAYKTVLKKIVEIYYSSKGAEGASFYRLYKEGVLKSKKRLGAVLETLFKCGYVAYKEREARTKSPKGRRDFYPTPMGFVMNVTLKIRDLYFFIEALLNQSPLRALDKALDEIIVIEKIDYFIEKISSAVTYAYILTKLYWPPKTTPPLYIEKGRQAILHATEQLRVLSTMSVEMSSEDLQEASMQKYFVENIKRELDEELNDLRDKKSFYRQLVHPIECSKESKDLDCILLNIFKDLEEVYEILLKHLASSRDIEIIS